MKLRDFIVTEAIIPSLEAGTRDEAIRELAISLPVPGYRNYMHVRAHWHAVSDGDLVAWTVQEVADFARRLEAMPRETAIVRGGVDSAH